MNYKISRIVSFPDGRGKNVSEQWLQSPFGAIEDWNDLIKVGCVSNSCCSRPSGQSRIGTKDAVNRATGKDKLRSPFGAIEDWNK
jgi:hypothetical protein